MNSDDAVVIGIYIFDTSLDERSLGFCFSDYIGRGMRGWSPRKLEKKVAFDLRSLKKGLRYTNIGCEALANNFL
jgi:hypothetical protein